MKKIISTILIVLILFSTTVSSLANSDGEINLEKILDRKDLKDKISKISSTEIDLNLDKYYEINDEIFMLLCKEKARREGKLFDLDEYEREIRNATTSEELQAVINKYDEYFVFEKERALTDTEFDSFAKANPEMRAQNRTAADFYIQEKVVWHKESLLQDKKEGIFNRILNDLLGIGIGYYAPVSGIVYTFTGYFTDSSHYYTSKMNTSTIADESLTKKTVLLRGTEYPACGYAERKRRYDTVKLTIWNSAGRVISTDTKYVGLVRDQYHDMYIDEQEFKNEAAIWYREPYVPDRRIPTYFYNSGGANDYKYNRTHYFK